MAGPAQVEVDAEEVRCCALVVGSTETNLHRLHPTLERELAGHGLMMVGPPVPLRAETVSDALNTAARADVCLLIYDHPVTPDEEAFIRQFGILGADFNPFLGSAFQVLADRSDITLPPDFRRLPTFRLIAEDYRHIADSARSHLREVQAGRRRPLREAVSMLRARPAETVASASSGASQNAPPASKAAPRYGAFVVGDVALETIEGVAAQLRTRLDVHGVTPTGAVRSLVRSAIEESLRIAEDSDVCLLVVTGTLSPTEISTLRDSWMVDIIREQLPAALYIITNSASPITPLPSELTGFPQFGLNLEDMAKLAAAIKEHARSARRGRGPTLRQTIGRIRHRMTDRPAAKPTTESQPTHSVPGTPAIVSSPSPDDPRLPATGTALYLSYAYEAETEKPIFDTARMLRRRGLRAQIDRLGFIDEDPNRTAKERYRLAVNNSDWYVLFMTEYYFARASTPGWSGVETDLENIEACVLRDPFKRERILPLVVAAPTPPADEKLPRVVLGLDRIGVASLDPAHTAQLIQQAMRDQPRTQARPVAIEPVRAMPQSELVRSILRDAAWIASGSTRDPARIPTGAIVLAMLHLGSMDTELAHSASWLTRCFLSTDGARVDRLADEYFPNWPKHRFGSPSAPEALSSNPLSYNAYSFFHWARLLAEQTSPAEAKHDRPVLHAAHLLVAMLHRRAPWTEAVDTVLRLIGLDPANVRGRLAEELRGWGLEGDPALWQLWNVPVEPSRQAGPPTDDTPPEVTDPDGATPAPDIGAWTASSTAASVSADDHRDERDHLDIQPDVEAFAKVLASWRLEPPLAIGLFGDWGSGKTFFMKRLKHRIEELSRDARDGQGRDKLQNTLDYCKYVVQVEFNAWHYSEGDLWACLVDHIFTNLRLTDGDSETDVARRRKALLAQLQTLRAAGDSHDQRDKETRQAIEEAQKQVDAARRKLVEAQNRFTDLSVRDIWKTVRQDPHLQRQIRKQLVRLGYKRENIRRLDEIRAAFNDAKSIGGRLKQTGRFLWNQRCNAWAYAAFFLVLVALPGFVLLASQLQAELQKAGAFLGAALSAIAGILPIYRSVAGHLTHVMDLLNKPQKMAEEARRHELEAAQKEIAKLTAQRDAAEHVRKDIERQQVQLQDRIDELNADRMLAEFLQDRAASDDYRKKLGTLALIRRDFERLADLMKTQRTEAMNEKPAEPKKPAEGASRSKEQEEALVKAKQELDKLRVNRIVLYIDDLDRCSPKQVVDVLQAIHLLLAFPLFVVVVGVDARWVHRSIAVQAKNQLRADEAGQADAAPTEAGPPAPPEPSGIATPRDYLEKIFQVPFWLQPMDDTACRKLIKGIVRPDEKKDANGQASAEKQADAGEHATADTPAAAQNGVPSGSGPAPAPGASPSQVAQGVDQVSPTPREVEPASDGTQAATTPTGAPAATPPGTAAPATGQDASSNPTLEPKPAIESKPGDAAAPPTDPTAKADAEDPDDTDPPTSDRRVLELNDDELEWMQELAPIIGRSPRAVKRFVNCYRLFKAVLPKDRVDSFVKQESKESGANARIALFFLALVVGEPELAQRVLMALQRADDAETLLGSYTKLKVSLGLDAPNAPLHLKTVDKHFSVVARGSRSVPTKKLRWIVDRALRFSFRSASISEELKQMQRTGPRARPPNSHQPAQAKGEP